MVINFISFLLQGRQHFLNPFKNPFCIIDLFWVFFLFLKDQYWHKWIEMEKNKKVRSRYLQVGPVLSQRDSCYFEVFVFMSLANGGH